MQIAAGLVACCCRESAVRHAVLFAPPQTNTHTHTHTVANLLSEPGFPSGSSSKDCWDELAEIKHVRSVCSLIICAWLVCELVITAVCLVLPLLMSPGPVRLFLLGKVEEECIMGRTCCFSHNSFCVAEEL